MNTEITAAKANKAAYKTRFEALDEGALHIGFCWLLCMLYRPTTLDELERVLVDNSESFDRATAQAFADGAQHVFGVLKKSKQGYEIKDVEKVRALVGERATEIESSLLFPDSQRIGLSKNFVAGLRANTFTHAMISGGVLTAACMALTMRAPIAAPDCIPHFEKLVQALSAVENASFDLTPVGNLRVTSGPVTIVVPCSTDQFTIARTTKGDPQPCPFPLRASFALVRPFAGDRTAGAMPVRDSVIAHGPFLHAMDGFAIVQLWTKTALAQHTLVLPLGFVDTVLAIKEEPSTVWVDDRTISVAYEDNTVITGALFSVDGAPTIDTMKAVFSSIEQAVDMPAGLVDAIDALKKATSETVIWLQDGEVSDSLNREEGARVACPALKAPRRGAPFGVLHAAVKDAKKFAVRDNGISFVSGMLRGVIGVVTQ